MLLIICKISFDFIYHKLTYVGLDLVGLDAGFDVIGIQNYYFTFESVGRSHSVCVCL